MSAAARQPLAWPDRPAPDRRYTEAEYLAFDAQAEGRWEFYRGRITPVGEPGWSAPPDPKFMAGASPRHYELSRRLNGYLFGRLPVGCRAFVSDAKVYVPLTGGYTFPDTVVVCGELEFQNPDAALPALANPVVIVEILSETTAEYDRFGKFARYRSIGSLRQYVLLDSRQARAEVLTRRAAEEWTYELLLLPTDLVRFAAGECAVALSELYEGLLPFEEV